MLTQLVKRYGGFVSKVKNLIDLAATNVPIGSLQQSITPVKDARKEFRQKFGRAISMDRIERAIDSAGRGSMEALTDLSRETINTDPHFCSVLFKRFGAVTTLPLEVHAASGPKVNKEKAKYYASVVRDYLLTLPSLRQRLFQLSWAIFDGRAAHEVIWKRVINQTTTYGTVSMVPSSLEWIHPRRLCFGPRRQLQVMDERMPFPGNFSEIGFSLDPGELRLKRLSAKFAVWTPSLFGDYQEREGLAARGMYWSFFKRFSQRERMILVELFGKPWRIIEVDEDSTASGEDLSDADEAADQLGGSSSARMPRGTRLKLESPHEKSGQNHREIVEDSNSEISKLVLGQTGTTDPNPAGINNTQADVMKDEQTVVIMWDAITLSEVVTRQLAHPIIEINYGPEELVNAPIFLLRWDRPTDRTADINRLKSALEAGVEVALTQAYESTGFRQPDADEPVVRIDQPPQQPGAGNPPLPRAVVVYPQGTSPEAGEQLPPAATAGIGEGSRKEVAAYISTADLAKVATVNEARAAQNLPPLTLPGGALDPDGDLTTIEFQSKKTAGFGGGATFSRIEVIGEPFALRKLYDPIKKELGSDEAQFILAAAEAGEIELAQWISLVSDGDEDLSEHKQPETGNGSAEDIIDNGMKELTRATGRWADHLGGAIFGLGTAGTIFNAINRAAEDLDLQPYARALERRMVQSGALGALDSNLDIGGEALDGFAKLPFQRAMQRFRKLDVVTRSIWDSLEADAKRKAFTISGMQSRFMVQTVHGELARQIGQGADLKEFSKWMFERLKSSGLIASKQPETGLLSATHVETVFRTNALNAYGAGRHSHQTQPAVLRVRPVWTISAIGDSRSRRNHRRAHGLNLYATDKFWERAYAPFGFNCRCRVRSRKMEEGLLITSGSSIDYLPDPGFVSGVTNLIR